MLIFGAGGAARAVAFALLSTLRPRRLTIAARTTTNAERLVRDLAPCDPTGALRVVPVADARSDVQASRLLVNATPLGMSPHLEGTPWPEAGTFTEAQIVYDLIYHPEHTRLLRDAAGRGAHTIGGLDMLILQAAASYVQWTGCVMPVNRVRRMLRQHAVDE